MLLVCQDINVVRLSEEASTYGQYLEPEAFGKEIDRRNSIVYTRLIMNGRQTQSMDCPAGDPARPFLYLHCPAFAPTHSNLGSDTNTQCNASFSNSRNHTRRAPYCSGRPLMLERAYFLSTSDGIDRYVELRCSHMSLLSLGGGFPTILNRLEHWSAAFGHRCKQSQSKLQEPPTNASLHPSLRSIQRSQSSDDSENESTLHPQTRSTALPPGPSAIGDRGWPADVAAVRESQLQSHHQAPNPVRHDVVLDRISGGCLGWPRENASDEKNVRYCDALCDSFIDRGVAPSPDQETWRISAVEMAIFKSVNP